MTCPKLQNFFMPPEWYPHECCWMQWPHEFKDKNSYKEIESWSHFDFEKGRYKWAEVSGIHHFSKGLVFSLFHLAEMDTFETVTFPTFHPSEIEHF